MSGLSILAGFLAAGSMITSPAAPPCHYYYFHEARPLQLDTARLAVYHPGVSVGQMENAIRRRISATGLQSRDVLDWSLVTLSTGERTAADIAESVKFVEKESGASFVSPVFIGDDGGPMNVTPYILVGFNDGITADQAERLLAQMASGQIVEREFGGMKGAYRIRSQSRNGFEVLEAANTLAQRAEIKYAEPDMIFTGRGGLIPNDPGFGNCWGLHNVGQSGGTVDMDMDGPEAWNLSTGSSSIIVVIIDVGVQQDHPDINQLTPGTDTTTDGGNGGPVNACDNHGTAVAGCVSAIINNSTGTVGIAPGCRSASARTFISNLDCSGSWTSQPSWTVNTLSWAQTIGARVTNNSNYYGFTSSAIDSAYANTRSAGIVHFASAGNDSSSTITYPSSLSTVNAVAALNRNGNLASFSNFGVGLAFSAPGQSIYTTDRTGSAGWVSGDYVFVDGTSFASPYAAGVAALVLSANPALTAEQVEEIIQQTCVDRGSAGYDTTYGWGFVNAYLAVGGTTEPDTSPPQPDPMTFSVSPAASGTDAVAMTATTATDATQPVQYMFQCTSATPGGTSSFWQIGTSYTDTGLSANTIYSYRVAARDSTLPTPNQTAFSAVSNAATMIETPVGIASGIVGYDTADLVALGTFTNLTTGLSGLYFESVTPGGNGGLQVWVQGTAATATGLSPDTDYEFHVKARNQDGVETAYSDSIVIHTYYLSGDCNNDLEFTVESDLDCIVDAMLGFETNPPGGTHRIDLNYDEITDGQDLQFIIDCLRFGGC